MNKIERWFLVRLVRREVMAGPTHGARITELYRVIRDACQEEFREDNEPTLNAFLRERFDEV